MVDAVHLRRALRRHTRDDQRRQRAQIARHHRRAAQRKATVLAGKLGIIIF